ncbi:MAG: hypothetical protein K2O05_01850, partial [Anaeroplasmataceae bacterium]|nr:hypothetical protein [Anaeroplasmataceae bacterium]
TPKMLCCANSIGFLNYKFYFHRIRKNSLGDRFDESVCESYFQTCKKLIKLANKITDENKAVFLKSRCTYLIRKIHIRINNWDDNRRKVFLDNNKENIHELTSILNLSDCFGGLK